VHAGVGAKLKIFTKTYIDVSLTVIDFSISIAQADGPFGGTNHSPVISDLSADPPSVNINQTTTITCTASDEDVGDTLTYSWAKTGGTFEGSTLGSTITWKAPSTKGNYTVSCEVSDSDQVIISVGDVNHAPVITSSAVIYATKGQPYSYDVNATDSNGDTLVYSLTTKPSGMIINGSTGLITWTPTATGSFGVTVKVSDGELFDTQSFTITVESTTTTDKPDLIVSNIWTEPNPPIAAGFTTIGIEIKNQGNADAIGTFFLEFYFDGTYQGHVYINGLTAGSTNTSYWQAVTWPSDINLHTIKGVVDPDNIINESSEINNQYSIQVKATEPPVGTGTLKIESVPGIAKVYIAGIYKGETPSSGYLTISDLTAGDHDLKVTKSGYKDWIGVVTIPSGSTQYKAVILESITTKPDAPTSLSPGTTSPPGPYINTLTPTLQWQTVPNADYYNLSVSIYPYGTSNIIYYNQQIYGNSITVPSGKLEAGNKYRWNMRAHNSAGYSDYSSDYYFQTESTLGQVQLSGPSNGATLPPMSVIFTWNPVSNATKYQFILYNQQGQVALDTIKTSTSLIVALGTEETITWKVRAGDNSGNWGTWSSTWSLTIKSLT